MSAGVVVLRRIYDTIGVIEKTTACLLLCAMGVVVFLQFFTRYVLNDSIGWTEEVARYLMIGTSFWGATLAVRHGTQLRIEMLDKIAGTRVAGLIERFIILPANIACFSWMTFYGYELASRTRRSMTMIDLPLTVLYWPVVIAFGLMVLHSLVHLFTGTPKQELPEIEGSAA